MAVTSVGERFTPVDERGGEVRKRNLPEPLFLAKHLSSNFLGKEKPSDKNYSIDDSESLIITSSSVDSVAQRCLRKSKCIIQ